MKPPRRRSTSRPLCSPWPHDAQLDVTVPIDHLPGDGAGAAPSGHAGPWRSSQGSHWCHSSHPAPSGCQTPVCPILHARRSINREDFRHLRAAEVKQAMAESSAMTQLCSFSLQHPSSWWQGCTSTHSPTARAQVGNNEDKAPSQGWDPLSGFIPLVERWIMLPRLSLRVEGMGTRDLTPLAAPSSARSSTA